MHGIRSTDQTGQWSNINCQNYYAYVCKAPAVFDTADPQPTLCTADGFTSWDDYYNVRTIFDTTAILETLNLKPHFGLWKLGHSIDYF